jgi:hypothetical protein
MIVTQFAFGAVSCPGQFAVSCLGQDNRSNIYCVRGGIVSWTGRGQYDVRLKASIMSRTRK